MTSRHLSSLAPLSLVAGTAAWCSRGVMEVVPGGADGLRIALLPPPVTWLPSVLLTLASLAAWLAVVTRWRHRRERRLGLDPAQPVQRAPVALLAPLYASGLLLLPWLPFAADVVRPLRLLAAPFGRLFWVVLVALVLVNSVRWIRERRGEPRVSRRRRAAWTVFAVGALLTALAAWRITNTTLLPNGDEPHYLVIAQSLWRDGDLRIQNNHDRGDYREYFDRDLAPHYLTRGTDGEIYSIHPIGLPVLLAPVYAAGGYRLVVLVLVLVGAGAAAGAWRLARRVSGSAEAATLAWTGIALSVPFVFNAFSVYPEVVGALLVLTAFATGLPREDGQPQGVGRWWVAGVCLSALPWLATKYALMTGTLAVVLAARALWPTASGDASAPAGARGGAWPRLAAIAVPGLVSATAWFSFFHWIWGTPSPAAPYGAMLQTSVRYLGFGAPGLLFDQEYGLFTYAPVLLLGLPGLWQMWRHGGLPRRMAVESTVVFVSLLLAVGAFRLWWGDASPGRPVASGVLLWVLPVSWYAARARGAGTRAWAWLLAAGAVTMTVVAVLAQDGLLVASTRDGLSRLLQWFGGQYPLWTVAPSYIAHHYTLAFPVSLVWLAVAALVTFWESRLRGEDALAQASGSLHAAMGAIVLVVGGAFLVPRVFGGPLQDRPPAGAGARSAVLEKYASTSHPLAVRYDPFTIEPAETALSRVQFVATPGLRTDPQPVPVLLNMRLSLPAGRYRATMSFTSLGDGDRGFALRLGRTGPTYQRFELPTTGSSWTGEFELPVDANFVGFEASRAVSAAVTRLDVAPVSIVDANRRVAVGQVLAAQRYPGADVFSHDEASWVEADGAWVAARRPAAFTIVPGKGGPVRVRLRNGPNANVVVLSGQGWEQRVPLAADQEADVDLPAVDAGGALALRITPEQGFVPQEVEPESRDRRLLGVFVRFP